MFDNFFENLRQMHIDRLLGDQPGREEPQQERMYSEEDILKSFDNLGFKQISSEELNSLPYQPFITDEDGDVWVIDKEKWFEQFKKK